MWRDACDHGSPPGNKALHVVDHRRLDRRRASRVVAGAGEEARVPLGEIPRLVVGRAADHHAVDDEELRAIASAAVTPPLITISRAGKSLLQPGYDLVVKRRDLAVLLRGEAVEDALRAWTMNISQPPFATVPTKSRTNRILDGIDALPVLHGHRFRHRFAHRRNALGDESGSAIKQAPRRRAGPARSGSRS